MSAFETVLVVDPDPSVLRDVTLILAAKGYNLLTAKTGTEAIRVFERSRFPIHLVLTAIMMPGIDGFELAQSLNQWNRKAAIVFMSEYNREMLFAENARSDSYFLRKPFTDDTLLQKVRDALGTSRRPATSVALQSAVSLPTG